MRFVVVLILAVAMLVLHATVAPRIAVWGVAPDLMVILVVQLAFRLPRIEALAWPWAAGLAVDLHDGGPAGVLALTYGLIAVAVDRLREFFFVESLMVQLAAVAAADLIQRLALLISQVLRGQAPSFMLFWKELFVGILYTVALGAVLLPLLSLALRRVLPRERRG